MRGRRDSPFLFGKIFTRGIQNKTMVMQNHQASKNLKFKNLLADFLRIYNQVSKTINIHRYETLTQTVHLDTQHF
jgi:hypothetical protein